MKQKINVVIRKQGKENEALYRMIANMNEGLAEFSARDLEGFLVCQKAAFPGISPYSFVKDEAEPNIYHVSEDGGKTFTLSLEWVEIVELQQSENIDDVNGVIGNNADFERWKDENFSRSQNPGRWLWKNCDYPALTESQVEEEYKKATA